MRLVGAASKLAAINDLTATTHHYLFILSFLVNKSSILVRYLGAVISSSKWRERERDREREMVASEAEQMETIQGKAEDGFIHTKKQQQKIKIQNKKKTTTTTTTTTKRMREEKGGGDDNGLVEYSDLPEYMKENEFIVGYYRSDWPIPRAILSLFSWHNETLNIWTHLLGFLVFLGLTLMHLNGGPQLAHLLGISCPWSISSKIVGNVSCNQASFSSGGSSVPSVIKLDTVRPSDLLPSSPTAARWPFFVFLAGSMFCLLTSSLCHLLCCHSRRLNLLLSRLDYVGIAVMIVASFFPPVYYVFQCDPHWRLLYLSAITAMGLLTVLTLLSPHLSKGEFRSYRAMLFCAMGLSGVVPAVHAVVVNWSEPRRAVTLAYEIGMAVSYLTGTFFYVSRIPERWRPGWFDLAGHSHQIFHVFVMAGALAHYGAALVFLEWRDAVACS